MDKTTFAGLTRLDPGETLSVDGYSFQHVDPRIIDRLLEIGAVGHRHDGHAALADPTDVPTVSELVGGGQILAGQTVWACYTLLDADGGETLPSPAQSVTTPAPLDSPNDSPSLALDTSAGTLLANSYMYAVTLTDGVGGETGLGPSAMIQRPPGPANARVVVSGLTAIATAAGAAGWRLWRSVGGGRYGFLAAGVTATDAYTDSGATSPDCTMNPPSRNTTSGVNQVRVVVPNTQPAGTVSFRIYLSDDGSFGSPALAGTYPIADAATNKDFPTLDPADGQPPTVSRSIPGAAKINAATDIFGLVWKPPVANAAALPSVGNTHGDVRATLDDNGLHMWGLDDAWHSIGGGGGGALPGWTSLPYAANFVDDTAAYGGGAYSKDAPEIVRLRGGVTRTTTPSFEGDIFATLPAGFTPPTGGAVSKIVPFWDSSAAAWVRGTVTILDTGEMYIENTGVGVGTLDTILLSDFTFRTT